MGQLAIVIWAILAYALLAFMAGFFFAIGAYVAISLIANAQP